MEKRVKRRSLRGLLVRYLITTGLLWLAVLLLWVVGFSRLWRSGFILTASAGAEATAAAEQIVAEQTAATLAPETLDPLCRYALFPALGSDTVLTTNMDAWHLNAALNAWHGGSGNLGYTQYHRLAMLADGSVCLLQYDYAVAYADPALRGLPDFQLCYLVLFAAALGGAVAFTTHRTGRQLAAEAERLQAATAQIAAGELTGPSFRQSSGVQIKEFDAALAAMQRLRESLADSLQAQWLADQQRADQISALTHDLKTPLTVISGNAELLNEDTLTDAQRQNVAAILRGADHAGRYLADLRAVTAGQQDSARLELDAASFVAERAATGRALCAPLHAEFLLQAEQPAGLRFTAVPGRLARAVDDLLDNAARYTDADGQVTLRCYLEPKNKTDPDKTPGSALHFVVRDTGPGFTPEALQKAGTLLYTDNTARPSEGHQGLGLYFARTVAQAHGGGLRLYNDDGGVTDLWIAVS